MVETHMYTDTLRNTQRPQSKLVLMNSVGPACRPQVLYVGRSRSQPLSLVVTSVCLGTLFNIQTFHCLRRSAASNRWNYRWNEAVYCKEDVLELAGAVSVMGYKRVPQTYSAAKAMHLGD